MRLKTLSMLEMNDEDSFGRVVLVFFFFFLFLRYWAEITVDTFLGKGCLNTWITFTMALDRSSAFVCSVQDIHCGI